MEIDELKKSWNRLNERLEKSNIVDETSVERLIHEHKELAEHSKRKLLRNARRSLGMGIILLVILVTSLFIPNHQTDFMTVYFITFLILGCAWDFYTYYYLRNTDILHHPVQTVVRRITRCHRLFIREYYVGAIFFLSCIILQAYTNNLIDKTWQQQVTFCCLWLATGGFTFWIIRKAFHSKMIDIKKNLTDLEELKES